MSDNSRIAHLLREAADKVENMHEDDWVHTVTVTLDGRSQTNVTGTIEYQANMEDALYDRDPVILH